ncbi:MAG: Translation initiation factor [Verrucomicrobiota bacterium]|jgi:translation initiation factor IF-1
MSEPAIQTTGTVLERKAEILYRVRLLNGKEILGHLSKPLVECNTEFSDGDCVMLEMTPFDFDQGRIVGRDLQKGL